MSENDKSEGFVQNMLALSRAFMKSRAFLTGYELGIFTELRDGGKSSADVAHMLGTDERATDRIMNALCSMGLLEKRGGIFSNTPDSDRFLVKGRPDYLAGLSHTLHLWHTWSTLTEAVKKGGTVMPSGVLGWSEDSKNAFIAAMHWRARVQAPEIASLIDLEGVDRLLDVGGGSGIFSVALVRSKKDIRATVFDLPEVVPLTQDYIRQEGFAGMIDVIAGDYNVDELPSGFDLVFLSAIIHSNSFDRNADLICKCANALNPNGRVVVQDFIMNEDRTSPAPGAMFALNMLVATKGGDTYTETEIRGWMNKAGLTEISRTESPHGQGLLIGRKKPD